MSGLKRKMLTIEGFINISACKEGHFLSQIYVENKKKTRHAKGHTTLFEIMK